MKWGTVFALLILLILPSAWAMDRSGHIKLLAVVEDETGTKTFGGSVADLYLEIVPGSGRVFLDTYPLTKLDTQISTRFAKEIACDYLDAKCDRYDFIYTIRSGSAIIGGPSAGAAITVLTVALLEGFDVDETVAVTGTINSGGIVGNVGAVKAKIQAASENGITVTLIPEGERFHTESIDSNASEQWETVENVSVEDALNTTNVSLPQTEEIDLVEFGKDLGVEVIPVSDISDVIYAFTGEITKRVIGDIEVDLGYSSIMQLLAEDLCSHSEDLLGLLDGRIVDTNSSLYRIYESAQNLTQTGADSFTLGKFYSAASFCFGANIRFTQLDLQLQNLSRDDFAQQALAVRGEIDSYESGVDAWQISTITDLETFMVVKERIKESRQYLELTQESLELNETQYDGNATAYLLSYTRERLNSAYSWSKFFGMGGREFTFDDESLAQSCAQKLGEAEERVQYVRYLLPSFFDQRESTLGDAYALQKEGKFALCLFTASKEKAQVDVFLSATAVDASKLDVLLENKLQAVQRVMADQLDQEIFPILGYSYFEYAQSLKETDASSALLYSEYALELGNMDLYFTGLDPWYERIYVDTTKLSLVLAGLILGLALGIFIGSYAKHHPKKTEVSVRHHSVRKKAKEYHKKYKREGRVRLKL